MSKDLYWRPVPTDKKPLTAHVKLILQKRIMADTLDGVTLDRESWLIYFEALEDAGVDGAEEVVAALSKHRTIELWIE